MATSSSWRALQSTLGRHIGVFILILGSMWLTVHFFRLNPSLLYAIPALYFVYLGLSLIITRRKRRAVK
jgi:threonine/homoserine/homoserine lactone efflux protein